ncbi:hypothetical protein [Streptomyces sp. NPDC006510]|uniref:hypothetical protein n=1 Tax=Streptomyces sp. NPDC006510 TaxID=3155600 RepID=UPI0033A9E461
MYGNAADHPDRERRYPSDVSDADPLYQQARTECGGYDTCVTDRVAKLRDQKKTTSATTTTRTEQHKQSQKKTQTPDYRGKGGVKASAARACGPTPSLDIQARVPGSLSVTKRCPPLPRSPPSRAGHTAGGRRTLTPTQQPPDRTTQPS